MDLATPAVETAPAPPRLDPPGTPARVGLLLLSSDLTTERDAARVLAPEGIAAHAARVAFDNPTTRESLRRMGARIAEGAALLVPGAALSAVCFSCTSGTVEIGGEAVAAAIRAVRPGVPVVTPPEAALDAFAALGARRVALLTPYTESVTAPMARWFAERGVEIVRARCLGMEDDRAMARVSRAAIAEAAAEADHPAAEALFVSCTALPALGAAAAIEARLGKPVVTSNQASLWRLRALAGAAAPREGLGRLLALPAPAG
ncbi:MAG: ectoine utilization protein EutA [Paracoccaceae bacterium]